MEKLLKNFFLFLSKNKALTKWAKKYGLRMGARRFVAGETIEETVKIIKELNGKGLAVTVDYLGEFVDKEEDAIAMADHCLNTVEAIAREKLDAEVSLKLTSMGMDISRDLLMENLRRILNKAKEYGIFVTIDMEDYKRCEDTIHIFKELKREFDNVGTVLQAYLYRTEQDLQDLKEFAPKLRLVKGAYKESEEVAYPDKKDVDENFKKIIRIHLENGHYTAIATHDEAIISYTKQLVEDLGIPKDQYEFQMLYGIRPERQLELAREGHKTRVYVPYGTDWFGFYMRRLAERPANVAFVLKNLFAK